jgi:hypothetical protein
MAARKKTTEIKVDASALNVNEILERGDEAPISLRLAAVAILRWTIAKITSELSNIKIAEELASRGIEQTKYKDVLHRLVMEGELASEEEKPVFNFSLGDKDDTTVVINMAGSVDEQFEVDPAIAAKSTLDLIPDAYKKVSTTLNKKAIEADLKAGKLPPLIASFCSRNPIEVTNLKVSIKNNKEKGSV